MFLSPRYPFRTSLLGAVVVGVLLPVLVIGSVAWFAARRAADDLASRLVQHKTSCVEGQIEVLLARAVERAAVARRFVGDRELTPEAIVEVLAAQARLFDVVRGLAYVGVGNVATGDYGILRRLPDGSTGLRFYALSANPREVRDYTFGSDRPTAAGTKPWDGYDFRERPFFRRMRASGRSLWTETYPFWKSNERGEVPGLTFVAPLIRGGELAAAIDVDFEIDDLSGFLRQIRDIAPGYTFVVETRDDGTRRVVAHPNLAAVVEPAGRLLRANATEIDDDIAKAALAAVAGQGLASAEFRAGGDSYVATCSRLVGDGRPPWEIVVVLPTESILGWVPAVMRLATLALVTVAGLALASAWLLSRRIARPLGELASQADALARGKPGGPVSSAGPAELVRLADDFNRMAEQVREREQRLRDEVADRRAAEERLSLHVRHTPLGVVEFDMDGTIRAWNPAASRIFGHAPADVMGRQCWFLVRRRDLPKVRAVWDGIGARREVLYSQNANVTEDGRVVECEWWNAPLIDATGTVVGIAAMVQDVTERERTREALAASERKFAKAFAASPLAIGISRVADGVLVDVNDGFCTLFGWKREELIGRSGLEMQLWYDSAEREAITDELRLSGRVRSRDVAIRTRSGEVRDGRLFVEVIDVDGVACALGAFEDITEEKKVQVALREAYATLETRVAERTAELAAANKELEAFSYSVSHDLRAPLRSVDGFSQALQEEYGEAFDDDGRDYLARIRAASRRMGELIDALLNLSRVARAEMVRRKVDLSAMARQIADALAATDSSRAVEFVIEPGVVVEGDANLLKIVLDNLLANAWKYTSKNAAACIEFGAMTENGRTSYFVRDDGAGFDPAYAAKLFQAFQRLHRPDEFEGHGVGLATVQRVVYRHGGRAWAEGAVGRGAAFYFTLGGAP